MSVNNNQIVRFKADSGQEVTITPKDVTDLICPAATQQEVGLFLAHCQAHHLDPFTKEAYLIKYGSAPASIVTNYNVFNARANRFDDYEGIEDGVVFVGGDGKVHHRAGSAVYPALSERLLGGWARVYRRGRKPVYVELALQDYSTGKAKWQTSPGMMINKCAKSAAWRTAYPSEFEGMYSAEEMAQAQEGAASEAPVEVAAAVEPVPSRGPADLSPVREVFRDFREATGLSNDAAMGAICAYCSKPSMDLLTEDDVTRARAWMLEKVREAAAEPAGGTEAAAAPVDDLYPEEVDF